MFVKIRNIIINTQDEPAMIVLSNEEKEYISNMDPKVNKFCSFPKDMSEKEIVDFMTKHPDDSLWAL